MKGQSRAALSREQRGNSSSVVSPLVVRSSRASKPTLAGKQTRRVTHTQKYKRDNTEKKWNMHIRSSIATTIGYDVFIGIYRVID